MITARLALLLMLGAAACGGATAEVVKAPEVSPPPAARPAVSERKRPQRASVRITPTDLSALFRTESSDGSTQLPPGILIMDKRSQNQQTPVRPTAMPLDALPTVAIPKPLEQKDAPKALLPNRGTSDLRTETVNNRSSRNDGGAVYIVLEAKMGRLQIGSINPDLNASDRVYRTCGDKFYSQPYLTPARWETFSIDGAGVAEYRVVDAWFDAQSCETSVVKTTVVRPHLLLSGLMYAFRNNCEDCTPQHTVTFLTPTLTQLNASGVGGRAHATQGTLFSIVSLPVQRGGAASFVGTAMAHSLKNWLAAQRQDAPVADVAMGVEIMQAVPDTAPQAIGYATFMKR